MAVKMAPGGNPVPAGCRNRQSGPRNLLVMVAELCIVFGKILWGLGFFVEDDFISVGGGREVPHRAGAGPTRGWGLGCGQRPPLDCVGPPRSPFWLRSSFLQ